MPIMAMADEHPERSSVHVAPLTIHKERTTSRTSNRSHHSRNMSSKGSIGTGVSTNTQSQITPPATPNGSQEDLNQPMAPSNPVFHNFLRAFYPFHPTYTISDSTVTLPLNEGDVILVHSIHTNGWADGTLLASGARGWLPTNYCEAYEPDSMRNLLKALLHFWDLMRSGLTCDSEVFGNQEFLRGIIAGVRYLLEKSSCLTRESPVVQGNDGLRKNRKALLSDLSSLVKTGKRLQEYTAGPRYAQTDQDDVNNTIDEMILKAFKIVTRGVRFLDVLDEDLRSRQPVHRVMATVAEEAYNPPTPPADSTSFDGSQHGDPAYGAASRRISSRSSASGLSSLASEEQTKRLSNKRLSRPISAQLKRQSTISHRMSLVASIPAAQRQNLVSEKLNASHDTFLSFLGSFIGRLHLQSQSAAELLISVRQSVTAGRELLVVVEAVCAHDHQSDEALEASRNAMYDRTNKLVVAARDVIKASAIEGEDVVMPQQNGGLLMAATSCVKAAGECVARTKFVIERIGDFEFEPQNAGLGIDISSIGVVVAEKPVEEPQVEIPPEPTSRPPPPPLIIPSHEKPLPDLPEKSPSPTDAKPIAEGAVESARRQSTGTKRDSLLPPLPKTTSPAGDDYSPSEKSSQHDNDFQTSFRSGSIAISSSGTSSTYLSGIRDSESSMLSQASTRATTPDHSAYVPRSQPSISDLSISGSLSTLADEVDEGESKMLEKTFAHELLYNKEGQITGGTLPALVERLTTHDSTPDAMLVSTFYLTFRLFATPVELATALVDRFDYVAESPHIARPVRLRVYNVFKGWLESHWRDLTDHESLTVIEPFAKEKLGKFLPGAGKQLLDLANKVTSTEGPLVPRLISSMGKTSTSIAQYIPADTPLPTPHMSKSSVLVLKNWKMGGSNPTILDFDPLELARQLTIKEMNIFCSIMPEELLGSEWTKRSGSNAVNVRAMSTLSTDLSNLVADTILQYEDAKKRATIIKHWIKIAAKCLELNNYDSLMAIICSLNSSTIIRLRRTWDVVSQRRKDLLDALQATVEPDKNYAILRKRLHDHVPPCLPFVGTYLTDLTFVDAGNPDTKQLPGLGGSEGMPVINFDKHTRTAKIIGELQRFQIPYRLIEVNDLQEWIQAQIVRVKSSPEQENVQKYYRKSLLLEPRETKTSPVEGQMPFSMTGHNTKFDIFGWSHSKDREKAMSTSSSLF
ncbi:hypothetical protein HYALB_00008526 [Hymenoscyphus albidus]|uniref:Ras guanine-nucleotide exchange protein n=1 Tax=Hymenoscyphus albidus TaxID=595503 RepID=A0A9N9LPV1_9HELO|nr:hypothetical protein HYALB_00008526 [Hymenoscyphus albidus]